MKDKLKLKAIALLRRSLIALCFCVYISLVGCNTGNIPPGTPLAVIATEPAAPAVLGLGEKLVVVIHCEPPTAEPVQIWTRPYLNGQPAQGYRAHRLETVTQENDTKAIVTGWFYYQAPKAIDEVRVFMRDVTSKEIIATHSYKIDVKWEGQSSIVNTAAVAGKTSNVSNCNNCGNCSNCNKTKTAANAKPCDCPNCVKGKTPTRKSAPHPADKRIYNINLESSASLGPQDAPVSIVEFGDFQCPYCVREFPKIQQIFQEYPKEVRFVLKHYPLGFHKKAPPAHAAAELARREQGPKAFWKMHDLILAQPKKLDTTDLRNYAQSLDLDLQQFDALMADQSKFNELLNADREEAKKCNVRGTPTVFINGVKLASRFLEGYKTRINQILNNEVEKSVE
jgi:protein-disulfide isomerase